MRAVFCVIVMRAGDVPALHDHLRNLLDRFNKLVPNSPCLTEFKEELYKRGWNPEDQKTSKQSNLKYSGSQS